MKTRRKVCAAVIRPGPVGSELLVFEHPSAGVQLPKGGLYADEDPQEGVLRELHEETGLDLGGDAGRIGVWERFAGGGPTESGPLRRHVWEVFMIAAPDGLPGEWFHEAWGSEAEFGLRLRCHWVPLDDGCQDRLHPLFGPVVAMIRASAHFETDRGHPAPTSKCWWRQAVVADRTASRRALQLRAHERTGVLGQGRRDDLPRRNAAPRRLSDRQQPSFDQNQPAPDR